MDKTCKICDKSIMEIKNGNNQALADVYECMSKMIIMLAYTVTGSYADAEDVLQETMLQVIKYAGSYKKGSNPRAWIMTMAHHISLDMVKRRKYSVSLEETGVNNTETTFTKFSELETLDMLKCLEKEEKQLVLYRLYWEFSYIEISKIMNIGVFAAQKRYQRAIKKLQEKNTNKEKKRNIKKAVLVLLPITVAFAAVSAFAIRVEAEYYYRAITFFNEYQLSIDGYSRSEIKEVYGDISNGIFKTDITARMLLDRIGDYDVLKEEVSSDDLKIMWEYYEELLKEEKMIQINQDGGVQLDVENCYEFEDGRKILFGYKVLEIEEWSDGWLALFNEDGDTLWEKIIDNGDTYNEFVERVYVDEQGINVFSRMNNVLSMSRFSMEGECLFNSVTDVHCGEINKVLKVKDYYVVHVDRDIYPNQRLIRFDDMGDYSEIFIGATEKERYFIEDFIEYHGQIYISTYEVPTSGNDKDAHQLTYIWDELEEYHKKMEEAGLLCTYDIKRVKLLNDHYTATLFKLDIESGEIKKISSMSRRQGGTLQINEKGELLWDVKKINEAGYYDYQRIIGKCRIFRYRIDKENMLPLGMINQTEQYKCKIYPYY